MPLPSSWKVLRAEPCSSVCSLPEEATLLWGERGAWSVGRKFCRLPVSSWLTHSEPHAWGLEGITDMDFFRGLGCICPHRPEHERNSGLSEKKQWPITLEPITSLHKNSDLSTMLLNIQSKPFPLHDFSPFESKNMSKITCVIAVDGRGQSTWKRHVSVLACRRSAGWGGCVMPAMARF